MKPLVSAIIGHYNRDQALARLLRCLHRQTYGNIEIIVTADGSPPHEPFLWWGKPVLLPGLIEQEGWDKVRWIDFERQENGLAQEAKCKNTGARLAKGEMLLLLCNDWWLEDTWVEKMVASLLALGKKNHMVGIQRGRRHQIMGRWPFEARIGPLPFAAMIDSGSASLLWREDWIDVDESLDRMRSYHQLPLWGHVLEREGHKLWYNSTLIMKHVHRKSRIHSHEYFLAGRETWAERREWFLQSDELYRQLCGAVRGGYYKATRLKDELEKECDEHRD